jgi:hypothetical protein
MKNVIEYEYQISLINLIIKSTSDILMLIKTKQEVDGSLFNSITMIFLMLQKIVRLLPEILTNQSRFEFLRNELINSSDALINNWRDKNSEIGNLNDKWTEFVFWWREYESDLTKIQDSKHAIYLSMN